MASAYPQFEIITASDPAYTAGFATPEATLAKQERYAVLVTDSNSVGNLSFVDPQAHVAAFTGHKEPSYFESLYYRVHFTPGQIELGNVLSVQTEEIKVWNAYLSSKEMTDYLEPSSQGVSVQEPVSAPYTMAALEELSYIVTVSTDGPPQFSTQIMWTIDGIEYSIPVSGQRVVVWPFGPNWDQPLNESLEWKTDVTTAFDGSEDRRPIRSKPRRRTNYRVTLHGNELNQFQNLLFGWQDRQFAVPVWQDKSVLADPVMQGSTVVPVDTTTRSFFKGGLAILMTDTYTFEVFEIDRVEAGQLVSKKKLEATWPRLTNLYPVNLGTLPTNIPTQRITSKVMACSIEFLADPVKTDPFIPGEPAAETLDGYEIIYRKPNWSTPMPYESEADFELLDYTTGGVQQIQKASFSRQVRRVSWMLKNRSDIRDFRALLGRRKGQLISAYVPTWFHDFEITEASGSGSSGIKVKRSQYDSLVGVQDTQNVVLIRLRDGTRLLRKIVGTSKPDAQTEQLNFDSPLPVEVGPVNTLMISLVHLCRLRQDGVTINYQSDSLATVEMTMMTVRA